MNPTVEYQVSSDPQLLDVEIIHGFLSQSYWAKNIPRELMDRAIRNSLCFGVYLGKKQAGFARVITDQATFAYLADVFILPEHRNRGLSKMMMDFIVADPRLQGLRRFLLATLDAHGLYRQFGFQPLSHPEHFMTIHKPDLYSG